MYLQLADGGMRLLHVLQVGCRFGIVHLRNQLHRGPAPCNGGKGLLLQAHPPGHQQANLGVDANVFWHRLGERGHVLLIPLQVALPVPHTAHTIFLAAPGHNEARARAQEAYAASSCRMQVKMVE